MTGCRVSWKCLVACLPVEESQQPTWPHAWHSRRATQNVPSTRHSSHALGVFCGGKSPEVGPSKCSHNFAICFSSSNHIHETAFRSVDPRLPLLVFVDQLIKSTIAGITVLRASSISQCPEPMTTWPRTSDATNLACSIRKLPLAFSPVRTSTGISRRVAPI
jgi:hypothetical protein